jgi:hypothetical protein
MDCKIDVVDARHLPQAEQTYVLDGFFFNNPVSSVASSGPDSLYGLSKTNVVCFELVETHSHHNSSYS